MAARYATLHELDTVYGSEDLHDMMEILIVTNINDQPEDS